MKKLFLIALLFVSVQSFGQFINNNPRIFNILNFGAKGDGKRVTDGVMAGSTTLTSATANFTAADVGKAIRVGGAAASSHDLITTITVFINSTTVTLGASGTITSGRCVYGTDNTTAIQNAIWADSASGGVGKVWIPYGVFCTAGALVTSAFGANPNAEIYFPVATIASGGGFYRRSNYVIEGETPPNFVQSLFADTLVALSGSVIYPLIDGSGNLPAVFGTKAVSASNLNFNYFTFKNLSIIVPQNIGNGGPSICGINMYYSASVICENVLVCADGSIGRSVQPTNEVIGIVGSTTQSEIQTRFTNCQVNNFKYGFYLGDDAFLDNSTAFICQYGLVIGKNTENVEVGYFKAYWNNNDVLIASATIGGYITNGAAYFHINNLVSEVFNANSGSWYDYSKVVVDGGNAGVGDIDYTIIQAGGTFANNLYNQTGGSGIRSRAIGSPQVPLNQGPYYAVSAPYIQGDLVLQSGDNANNFLGWNTQEIAGGNKAVRTAAGAKYGFNNAGGLYMATAPSVTAGAGQTFIFPFLCTNNGNIQMGNSVTFTPLSWTDFTPSTTAFASINIPSGTAPTSPNTGDVWSDGTNLKVNALNLTPVTSAAKDLGTTSLNWRVLFAQSALLTGAETHSMVDVSATGTYSATGTDYTIQFTGSTATLVYPTLNLLNGRHLSLVNNGSGTLTIPSTKTGNASTITSLTTGQRAQVEYDLTNTTWIQVN